MTDATTRERMRGAARAADARPPGHAGSAAAAAVVAVLALLVGGDAAFAQADGPARPDPFPILGDAAPAGSGATQACDLAPGTVRCGVFRVLEDRSAGAPEAGTLDIHFVILEATDPDARTDDPVLYFFGGPGGPTIPAATGMARRNAELRRTRDLVLVDLRGIGRSGALTCDVPYPSGFLSRFGTLFELDHLAACRDILSRRAQLEAYTTATTVDDLEELRRWLGYGRVNLNGGSYGTRVAQVYMRRHPAAVRTAVMNGVTSVTDPTYVRTSPNLQRALEGVISDCAAQSGCAAAYPDLARQVDRAFARFDDGPVSVELDGRTVPFHRADLGYAFRGLLYGQSGEVPYRVAQAARGEFSELAEYYVQRTAWVASTGSAAGNHLSVVCAEDVDPLTGATVRDVARGTFLQGHVIESYRRACDIWPHADLPDAHFEPVSSDVPTLLLSGGRDPVTPPANAELVARTLANHLHVVVPNAGHGVGGPCVAAMILRLVETGSLEGIDTSCVATAPATEFRLR